LFIFLFFSGNVFFVVSDLNLFQGLFNTNAFD